ncbi:hypothetical protein LF41_1372 [Lysobacter dokdonensis DS-58]|uniref:Lipoprotein n=1 Tax=Lysobacter dokdonensis DS-58 TaxID=1300345 RepID=A0A0A2WF40_9GAMM|nr:hypothetical protein [Lysobacter dokdonensis]KGQ18373.1 hypothetical protein LF41_1372 [Lysobacter dokdonensis DS-58]
MRKTSAIVGLALALAGCGNGATSTPVAAAPEAATQGAPVASSDPRREALANILTCRDRTFLALTGAEQRAALVSIDGVACDAAASNAPQRCTIAPAFRVGIADIGWFVIGRPSEDLTPIVLPAPPEALRNAIPAGSGALSPGTDLGDTTVQCAMRDHALDKGAIAGTVKGVAEDPGGMRVCAFELAEGNATCTQTARGVRDFRLDVARGDYLVLAIPVEHRDTRVGFTDCDADADDDTPCSHELNVVTVRAGETTRDIDPADMRSLDEAGDWPQPPPAE